MFRPSTVFTQKAKQSLNTFTPIKSITSAQPLTSKQRNHGFWQFFDNVLYSRTGRSWTVHELRLKSPTDLEKLWFVILKERNALATYQHYCAQNKKVMRGYERITKCKASMKAILHVVAERRHAFKEITHDTEFLTQRTIKRQTQALDNFEKRHETISSKTTPNQHKAITMQNKKWRRKTMGQGLALKTLLNKAAQSAAV
jgi:hypothetical protein